MKQGSTEEAKELGSLLLDIGGALLSSGASCSRIRITMLRIANTYHEKAHISIAPKSISLTLKDSDDNNLFTGMHSIQEQGVNFKTISGISRLSWEAVEKDLKIQEVREKFNALLVLPHYPRLVVLLLVSLAGAGFCFSFGGKVLEMLIAFGATFCGLFIRQEAIKRKFNPYICVFLGRSPHRFSQVHLLKPD